MNITDVGFGLRYGFHGIVETCKGGTMVHRKSATKSTSAAPWCHFVLFVLFLFLRSHGAKFIVAPYAHSSDGDGTQSDYIAASVSNFSIEEDDDPKYGARPNNQ